MTRTVFFSSENCFECNTQTIDICQPCMTDASVNLYEEFRKVAPKADKVVLIGHNCDWQGKTGYMVFDFNKDILNRIMAKTPNFIKVFYKEGRKVYLRVSSHDVPQWNNWELVPVISKGRDNDTLIANVIKMRDKA